MLVTKYLFSRCKMKINKINCTLLILLIILVSLIFKYALTIHDPNIVGGYNVGTFRQTIHIIGYHHFFTSKQKVYTYFSNVGNAPGYYPRDLLFSITAIITGKTHYTDLIEISRFLPIQTVVLIPLASLLIYNMFFKIYNPDKVNSKYRYLGLCSMWLFATFGFSYLTSPKGFFYRNALYSWFFVLMFFYVLTKKMWIDEKFYYKLRTIKQADFSYKITKEIKAFRLWLKAQYNLFNSPKKLFSAIYENLIFYIPIPILILFILLYKYTVGLMFLVLFLTITFLSIVSKNKRIYKNFLPVWLIGLTIFLIRYFYIIEYRGSDLIRQLKLFFEGKFFQPPEHVYHILRLSSQSYLHFIELALPLVFILPFFYYYLKRRDDYNRVIFYSFFSLPILAVGFFLWLGYSAIYYRTSQTYTIISIITVGYVLARICIEKPRLIKYLVLAIITASLTSSYIVINAERPNYDYDYSENNGIVWAGNKINNQDAVFSDFRIGTPLVFYHFTRIHGINRINYPKDLDIMYDKIYQNISDSNLEYVLDKIAQTKGSRPKYIIFSEKMSTDKIMGADIAFRAAKEGFREKYDFLEINKIYSNNEISIYRV